MTLAQFTLPKVKRINSYGVHVRVCVCVLRVGGEAVGGYGRQRSHNSRQSGQDQAVSWTIHFQSSLY